MYARWGKRYLDLAVALPILALLWPFLLVVALLIRLDSRGPALFVQQRLGQHGRLFRVYKFRTMTNRRRERHAEIVGRNAELTRIGQWLRRYKIDELPQLVNVVLGEMSLVGPRPALPQQAEQYDAVARRRLAVRPGLTGLAQVNGNIYLSWPERWAYDVAYVERLSLALDCWIIWRTVGVILFGERSFLSRTPERERQ